MKARRCWSYQQLTNEAERSIASYRSCLLYAPDDTRAAYAFASQAHAVFQFWALLTGGWQQPGDRERLEAVWPEAL